MDEFDQAKTGGEAYYRSEVPLGFFASRGGALEAFEAPKGLLDTGYGLVRGLGEYGGLILLIVFVGKRGTISCTLAAARLALLE